MLKVQLASYISVLLSIALMLFILVYRKKQLQKKVISKMFTPDVIEHILNELEIHHKLEKRHKSIEDLFVYDFNLTIKQIGKDGYRLDFLFKKDDGIVIEYLTTFNKIREIKNLIETKSVLEKPTN